MGFSDINIALHDGVVSGEVNTRVFFTKGDNLTVWEFVLLFETGHWFGHFIVKVLSDVAEFFFYITDDFSLGGGGEVVTAFVEDFHHVVGQVSTGEVHAEDSMW